MERVGWGGDRFVGLRGYIAGPGGVGGNGGIFRRQLKRISQTRLLVRAQDHCIALVAQRTYWFQREDARCDDEDKRNDNQRS